MNRRVMFVVVSALSAVSAVAFAAVPAGAPSAPAVATDAYRSPGPSEPRALVQIQTTYDKRPGNALVETISLAGKTVAAGKVDSTAPAAPRTIAVVPGATRWVVRAEFSKPTTTVEKKTVTGFINQVHPCGGFSSKMCTDKVAVTKVVDWPVAGIAPAGACEAELAQDAVAGANYRLEFAFHDAASCELRCWSDKADGSKVSCDGKVTLPGPVAAAKPAATPVQKSAKASSSRSSRKKTR